MQKNTDKHLKVYKRTLWKFWLKSAKNAKHKLSVVNVLADLEHHFKQRGARPLCYDYYLSVSTLGPCTFNALLYSEGYNLQYNANKSFDVLIVKARKNHKKVKNAKKT